MDCFWVYAFNQQALWAILLGYGVIIIFQSMVIRVLLDYIFRAKKVNRDVIYAASTVYLLLGAVFVPIYGIVEALTYEYTGQHAFSEVNVGVGDFFPWQHFVYFSYVTLTTAGYGDILPLTMWARSLANLEAVIGVLYLTIIMARLVGLCAQEQET